MSTNTSPVPAILMLNTNRGVIGGVERLLIKMAEALGQEGWQVYGLFEHSTDTTEDFDQYFTAIRMWKADSLSELIPDYQAQGIKVVCIHKSTKSRWIAELQNAFKTVLIVHDHDYYCLRKHKYFPYKRINCHLPFNPILCSICGGLGKNPNGSLRINSAISLQRMLKVLRRCDASMVLSEYMRLNLLQNKWKPSRVHLLKPYQDVQAIGKTEGDIPVLLYAGQLIRGKGVDLLFKALAELKDIKFVCKILGRGNDEDYLKQLAQEMGLADRIVFLGFSTKPEEIYAGASILVIPSRWQEPFGLVGLEAFASQIPVVAFDTGGIKQWLKHRVNGILVREGDHFALAKAIKELLLDPIKARRYGKAGYDMLVESYSRSAFKTTFMPIIRNLHIASSGSSSLISPAPSSVNTLLSLAFTLMVSIPILGYLIARILVRRPIPYRTRNIYGKNGALHTILLLDSSNWLIRNALTFPMALVGKLSIVGVSLRDYAPHQAAPEDIRMNVPGVFNLHFIRSSSKISLRNQDLDDRDYLAQRSLRNDLAIVLQSILSLIYYQDGLGDNDVIDIFGIKMQNLSMKEALDRIHGIIMDGRQSEVYFVNADCLNKVFIDKDYYSILSASTMVFPDGSGINLAGKMLGSPLKDNINGTDMLPYLCEMAQKESFRIFLLGAAEGVADAMRDRLISQYPHLQICGTRNGYFDPEHQIESVIQEINAARPHILLVAFGAPLQEKFIQRYKDKIQANILMGVGGLFDFYSGRIARAPIWMRQIGFEWIFRLMQEPKRMWKRYIIGNPLFLYRVFRYKRNRNYLGYLEESE